VPVAGLVDIMDAMVAQIAAAVSDDYDVQVFAGVLWNPTPPTIDVYPGGLARNGETASFDDISGGYLFTVRARVLTADIEAGQQLLWRFMDDTDDMSIAGALMADPTLNGYADSLSVRDIGGAIPYPTGVDGELLGFSFTCEVLAGRS